MGVTKTTVSPGNGQDFPRPRDHVTIHYTGHLETPQGRVFDSSVQRNDPFQCTIGVGDVIQGWDEGVPQMSLGEKAILTITPDYGYGEGGYPPVIPPRSTLVFEVELLAINGKRV